MSASIERIEGDGDGGRDIEVCDKAFPFDLYR